MNAVNNKNYCILLVRSEEKRPLMNSYHKTRKGFVWLITKILADHKDLFDALSIIFSLQYIVALAWYMVKHPCITYIKKLSIKKVPTYVSCEYWQRKHMANEQQVNLCIITSARLNKKQTKTVEQNNSFPFTLNRSWIFLNLNLIVKLNPKPNPNLTTLHASTVLPIALNWKYLKLVVKYH